ncbi:MAG: peptidoglycan-binding protein [Stigonema ocellatum SAG 48.90 = DSM 106950]|nr:peptidoglycan-binding protein [Stigonema ocellatum SAG 48.90 = DSM 106950]
MNRMFIKGVDIAEFSEQVNWQKMKAEGFQFAYARVLYGTVRMDLNFHTYWTALKQNNIIRGAYLFFRPSDDLNTQVRLFAQAVDMEPGDLPPSVDLEFEKNRNDIDIHWSSLSTAASIDLVETLLKSVERTTGYKPIIYANSDFWIHQMGNTSRFSNAGYDLWIANYNNNPNQPNQLFGGWKVHTFHQYLGDQKSSFTQDVDYNTFNGNLDRLKAETVPDIPLQEGRIGVKVNDLQKRLTKLANDLHNPQPDLNPHGRDGIFGPDTKKAVIAFQKINNLVANGVIKLEEIPV